MSSSDEISKDELYKAINSCLKPVKTELTDISNRAKEISVTLDKIETRVKALNNQLTNIEDSVKTKARA